MIRAAAVLGLLLLAGCSFDAPTARVVSVEPAAITDDGVRLLVTVELDNPNDVDVPLPWTQYKVKLDGSESFAFATLPAASLPPLGTQRVPLPAAFARRDTEAVAGRSYAVSGSVTYEPPGALRKLLTEYRIPLPTVGFADEGELD